MATNSKLNSDPVCALSFEFELKDLRCAKAALSLVNHPSSVLCRGGSQMRVSRSCWRCHSDPSVCRWKSDGQLFPYTRCRTRQNGRSFSLGRTSKWHSDSFQCKCFQVLFLDPDREASQPGSHSSSGLTLLL